MALVLGGTALLLVLAMSYGAMRLSKGLSSRLAAQDETFRHWLIQDHLGLDRFKAFLKKIWLLASACLWMLGIVWSGVYEGVAYTVLVAALGWAPSLALAFVFMGLVVLMLKLALGLNFMVRWLFKVSEARQRVEATSSVER